MVSPTRSVPGGASDGDADTVCSKPLTSAGASRVPLIPGRVALAGGFHCGKVLSAGCSATGRSSAIARLAVYTRGASEPDRRIARKIRAAVRNTGTEPSYIVVRYVLMP